MVRKAHGFARALAGLAAGLLLAGGIGWAAQAERVDINRADAATLARVLHGVGPNKARAIVEYRRKHGPFRRPEDLIRVKGIGRKTVERNRGRIVVGAVPPNGTAGPASGRARAAGE